MLSIISTDAMQESAFVYWLYEDAYSIVILVLTVFFSLQADVDER